MATVNLGRIKPIYKGEYSGATAYKALDIVLYGADSYVALQDTTGNLPTNATYFGLIANVTSERTNPATLTNKTLTSPDINGGTVDGAVIGGAVPAAGSFTTLSAAGSATVGNGSGNNAVLVNSTASGTGGGGAAIVQNGGTSIIAIGNKSALLGGAYNATPMLYGSGATIEVNTGLSVTGGISATTTGADNSLHITRTGYADAIVYAGGANASFGTTNNYPVTVVVNNTNVATFDTSGNLGLGVVPSGWVGLKAIQIGNGAIGSTGFETDVFNNVYFNGSFRYTSTGIASYYSQSNGANTWYTAPSGTAGDPISFTQAMTLDASGNLLVGTTSVAGSVGSQTGLELRGTAKLAVFCASDEAPLYLARRTSDGAILNFRRDTTAVGSISVSATATAYNTTSDARLKENITDSSDAASLIDALQVRQFDWKSDGSHQRYGFVAQELYEVAPEAVSKPQDPDEMMAVDYSKLVPMLVKEVQALRQRVAALEPKLNGTWPEHFGI